MKKIVLIINDFNIPEHALQYALSIAAHAGGTLYGLFINNIATFSSTEPFTIANVTEQNQMVVDAFELHCEAAGIPCKSYSIERFFLDELVDRSAFSDLIVCDADTAPSAYSMNSFLANAHCPVLLINKTFRQIDNIVLTYEDKISGIHAIKHFSYLFSGYRDVPAHFVSVVHENVLGLTYNDLIQQWLPLHFPNAQIHILKGDVHSELPRFINGLANPLVVMGSFGRSALSRFFKESLASIVLQTTDAPVFVAHN